MRIKLIVIGGRHERCQRLNRFNAHLSGGADFRGNYLYFKKNGMFWSSAQTSEERAYYVGINDKNTWNKFVARKLEPTKLTM